MPQQGKVVFSEGLTSQLSSGEYIKFGINTIQPLISLSFGSYMIVKTFLLVMVFIFLFVASYTR